MKCRWKHGVVLFLVALACWPLSGAGQTEGIDTRKIWDGAEHSAFTDLIWFKDSFYCSFREGNDHIPGKDGEVRILKSRDGVKWESAIALKKEGIDLRDPKLSVTPDGRLMVIMGGSIYKDRKLLGRAPQVSFSDKAGIKFSAPEKVEIDPTIVSWGDWLWRVTWFEGTGYTIDYQIGPEERKGPTAMYLLKTKDGKKFEKVSKIDLDGFPNEATIRFDKKGTMHVLIRRETADQMGVLAQSEAPFTNWKFNKMDVRLGGPNFVFTDDQKIIMGTRVYEANVYTGLFLGDASGKFRKVLSYNSSGDNSYPGMVIRNGALWVSYYSSHEGKSSIYFSKVPLSFFAKAEAVPDLLPSTKIWDKADHSAFTDLIQFKNKFLCTFREGEGHSPVSAKPGESGDGRIRIIGSSDGQKWESVAVIEEKGIDLRDPKLSIMPNGRLMITCGGSDYDGKKLEEWHTRTLFSDDGVNWTKPVRVRGIPSNNWFFRITWKGDVGYVAANTCPSDPVTGLVNTKNRNLIIYKTLDGLNYEKVSGNFNPTPEGCEATIRFKEDDTMVLVIRNAGGLSTSGFLATSFPPYEKFAIVPISHGMGGPNLLQLDDKNWLVGTREMETQRPGNRKGIATVLIGVNSTGIYKRLYELPSGGDASYPGFAEKDGQLWISYYSSHEGKSSVYLSRVPMAELKAKL